MSIDTQHNDGGPILPGSPLARAMDGAKVPHLSAGFADRVVAAAMVRPAPLPQLRRSSGWRTGRRLVFGLAGVAALASAAAATGLLHQIAPSVPSVKAVWASLAGPPRAAPAPRPEPVAPAPVPAAEASPAPADIAGPIDTPEELGEAFRRADQRREARRAMREQVFERRLAEALVRRREAGLPDPTPAELAALRERIAARAAQRQQAVDAQVQVRREDLQRRVANGEALTGEDFAPPKRLRPPLPAGSDTFERLRAMTPAQRREAVRAMPAEDRAMLREELRARRTAAAAPVPAGQPTTEPAPAE